MARRQKEEGFDGGMLDEFEFVPTPQLLATVSEAERAATCVDERVGRSRHASVVNAYLMDIDAVSSVRVCGGNVEFRTLINERLAQNLGNGSPGFRIQPDLMESEQQAEALAQALRYRRILETLYASAPEAIPIDEHLLALLQSIMANHPSSDPTLSLRDVPGTYMSRGYRAPSPGELPRLLRNLMAFANRTYSTPLIHSTITQFKLEAYEPVMTDIDYIGRLLAHALLHHRGLTRNIVLPIAMYAAKEVEFHATNLFPYKTREMFSLEDVNPSMERFIYGCAISMIYAATIAHHIHCEITGMSVEWKQRIGEIRRGSALEVMLDALPAMPLFNAECMCGATGRSETSVNAAIRILLDKGIIEDDGHSRRNRVFSVPRVLAFFNWIERSVFPDIPIARESFVL